VSGAPGWKPSPSEIRENRVLVFGRHPASPTFRALLADVSSTGLPHLVEHRDARNRLITHGRERNQPGLVGVPSSLLGLPRPGPPARGSGALRRGFLFQLLAERPADAGRERDARVLVIFNNPSKARWAFCGRARANTALEDTLGGRRAVTRTRSAPRSARSSSIAAIAEATLLRRLSASRAPRPWPVTAE
jgi:hypothetical protein